MASDPSSAAKPAGGVVLVWIGRVLSLLIVLLFTFSGVMKFVGGPELEKGMAEFGLPSSMVVPLAVIELTCVVLYAVPMTAVLGAVLLTGYLGGAICTHWRIGDPVYAHVVIGVVLWLALYFREPRLRKLLPVRWKDAA